MLNANNKVNYEPKQKEKKYSLSTVLAWLYLKTIGRILPERWNKWAENILHHNKVIVDSGVQTDDLLNSNREKELKDENERLKEKLKEGSKKEENQSNLNQELTKKEKEITKLKEQVKSLGEEKEIFAKFFAEQAQQIEDLELESNVLKEEKEQLNSIIKDLKKDYRELAKIAQKRGEEFLAQFKKKSEEILHLQKELIECSKEFANKIEMLSVRVEEKDGEIGSLTELNKTLEQEKKEMETKNNEQKQVISDLEKRIKEQEDLIKSFHENKDINETVKKENENLRVQKTELENEVSKLKNEFDTKIKQLNEQKKAELEQAKKKDAEFRKKLESAQQQLEQEKTNLNTIEKKKQDLESEINELKEQAKKKGAELQSLKQQLEKEKTNLNTIEKKKQDLEGEVKELKEKLQILEKNSAEIEKQKTDLEKKLEPSQRENKKLQKQVEHLSQEREKATSIAISSVGNNVETLSETLKNQQIESSIAEDGPQELKEKSNNVDTKLEDMDKKTKEVDAISIASTTKKTLFHSMKSSFSNGSYDLFSNKKLKEFLSHKNRELKKGFPELEGKHFCHNVLDETIKSLSNQGDGKFESDKLLELLKSNLMKFGRAIIEIKVNTVVEKVGKKHSIEQVIFVQECAKGLYLNEEDSQAIISSLMEFLAHKNNSNNDSVKKFVVQKLTEAEMKCFSDKIQGLQLASSIRDKFLSPDQGMCNQTQGGVNEYQLTKKAKKEYELTPNSSMRHTTSSNIQRVTRVGS
ncbi:hypothetical protein [Wolbachia endosymbiont (group B) of Horisme vitalbata]|uniref:hypothetical protein n=1 Tax=Wolbachia endosymbiont (group B) of Horisme vitalbata TaxID=3066178 RepID=UPI00333F9A15